MSRRPIPDAELVNRALAGSADAYHDLVRRYERPVMSLIVRLVGDPARAEDLAQESFVKACRNLSRFDPERRFASWLFKIAHNTTIDFLRRQGPETVSLADPASAGGDGPEIGDELPAPAAAAPDLGVARSELAAALERAIAGLKPSWREVVLLRFREGLSYAEIVEVTGQPMGTVKIHLHRARKQLAATLGELGFAPGP